VGGDQREQAQPDRVAEGLERGGVVDGRVSGQRLLGDRRAAARVQQRQRLLRHTSILTVIESTIKLDPMNNDTESAHLREQVRARYAAVAEKVTSASGLAIEVESSGCCGASTEVDETFGAALYSADEQGELPTEALLASLGCGNPLAVAD